MPDMEDEMPVSLLYPITGEVFVDPVVARDGHTYEREAILEWLRRRAPVALSYGASITLAAISLATGALALHCETSEGKTQFTLARRRNCVGLERREWIFPSSSGSYILREVASLLLKHYFDENTYGKQFVLPEEKKQEIADLFCLMSGGTEHDAMEPDII